MAVGHDDVGCAAAHDVEDRLLAPRGLVRGHRKAAHGPGACEPLDVVHEGRLLDVVDACRVEAPENPHRSTLVRPELSLREFSEGPASFPPKLTASLSTMSAGVSWNPVSVPVAAEGTAGEEMLSLLSDEYGATGEREGDWWKATIRPIDQFRRGTIIYCVIQASRTLAAQHPETTIYLVTEDGNRRRLPPPALEAN
jgi:hypothetical protein